MFRLYTALSFQFRLIVSVAPISEQVLRRQLLLLGRVARADEQDRLRANVFVGASLMPQAGRIVRRVGRPRLEWTRELFKLARRRSGTAARTYDLLREGGEQAEVNWKVVVARMFSR